MTLKQEIIMNQVSTRSRLSLIFVDLFQLNIPIHFFITFVITFVISFANSSKPPHCVKPSHETYCPLEHFISKRTHLHNQISLKQIKEMGAVVSCVQLSFNLFYIYITNKLRSKASSKLLDL